MTLNLTAVDYVTLPTALLPDLKTHARIDHADEDAYLKQCLARAIAHIERVSELSIFAATFKWTLNGDATAEELIPVPRQPVKTWTATSDSTDVTADCELIGQWDFPQGPVEVFFKGPADLVTLEVGFAGISELYPGLLDVILRLASQYYQYREATTPNAAENFAPDWLAQALSTLWVPRV